MSKTQKRKERIKLLKEGYHEYDEVTCEACNEVVDLSNADNVNEAIQLWNKHAHTKHE